jgi:hypothetical protein
MGVSSDALAGLLRPPPPKPKQPTARERAATNRLNVLRAVAEHGSLRCVDLAAACWPGARYGEQMAQRTVRARDQVAGRVRLRRVLTGFIADLAGIMNWADNPRADGYSSNGSDERRMAMEYYERVGYPWFNGG